MKINRLNKKQLLDKLGHAVQNRQATFDARNGRFIGRSDYARHLIAALEAKTNGCAHPMVGDTALPKGKEHEYKSPKML